MTLLHLRYQQMAVSKCFSAEIAAVLFHHSSSQPCLTLFFLAPQQIHLTVFSLAPQQIHLTVG